MENKFEWKKAGALALVGIIDRNKVLLGKWLWWYPLDFQSVWAPMIWSKYEQAENHQAAINVLHSSHRSPWIQVLPSFLSQNCLWDVAKIWFWVDPWVASTLLSSRLPRLFNLSNLKEGGGIRKSLWRPIFSLGVLFSVANCTRNDNTLSSFSFESIRCNLQSVLLIQQSNSNFFFFFFYQQIKVISLIKNRVILLRK